MHCGVCGSSDSQIVGFVKEMALVSAAALPRRAGATVGLGRVALASCGVCGFIYNSAFDERAMRKAYISASYALKKPVSASMSGVLRIVRDKVAPYINDARVLEVGSGDSSFSRSIASEAAYLVSVDPACEAVESVAAGCANWTHMPDFFSLAAVMDHSAWPFDFAIARHLLEHLPQPARFLRDVYESLAEDGRAYIEVPNMDEVMDSGRVYDIFHDHVGYFRAGAFEYLCAAAGFTVVDKIGLYGHQHMGYVLKKVRAGRTLEKACAPDVEHADWGMFTRRVEELNSVVAKISGPVGIWGAGAHGNATVNYLDEFNRRKVTICFDKDQSKVGRFLQACQARVVTPTKQSVETVQAIVIAAALHENEIADYLEQLQYRGVVVRTATGVAVT